MPASPISEYLARLRQDFRTGSATERTYYATLQALVEAIQPGVKAPFEQKRIECGAIDFHVEHRGLTIGYIEAKDIGDSLDEAEKTEQLQKRYIPNLPNLILTNYLEFRWYRNGAWQRTATLGRVDAGSIRSARTAEDDLRGLLNDFLAVPAQGATNAKDLAIRLAHFAHEIRIVIAEAFAQQKASPLIADLRDAVRKQLVPDLADEQFADMFTQTLVYGFFAAWCNHPLGRPFQRLGASSEIPRTNPFLRRLFEILTGADLDEEPFAGYVDDLIQLLQWTDRQAVLEHFGRRGPSEDPVIHFYETFLRAYDPGTRLLRGIFYTPEPVVYYIVRSVDHLLRTRLGCPRGLADEEVIESPGTSDSAEDQPEPGPRVLVLDPACGTGTFLYAVVDFIRERFMSEGNAGRWSGFVRTQLLPRVFGFELLMAPYAVSHLKLAMLLAAQDLDASQRTRWSYDFSSEERLGVFLTNTLEGPEGATHPLPGPFRVITEEADAAAAVKHEKPIMVVLGNPPYSKSICKGKWILGLLEDYKRGLGERKVDLNREEWKFLRFAQWRVERTGEGIVGFVINNTFLDALTHRRLRESLMETFSEIYILNLRGAPTDRESGPSGIDENIFDIRKVGITVLLLVRSRPAAGRPRPSVYYYEIWGTREEKRTRMSRLDFEATPWEPITPEAPDFRFVPVTPGTPELEREYNLGRPFGRVFGLYQDGVKTDRDDLFLDFDRRPLVGRMRMLFSQTDLGDDFVDRYNIRDSSSYKLLSRRAGHRYSPENIQRLVYRPFDFRWIYYSRGVTSRPAYEVMRHMLPPRESAPNVGIVVTRQTKDSWEVLASDTLVGHKSMAANEINSLAPLYLYPQQGTSVLRDEKLEQFVKAMAKTDESDRARRDARDLFMSLFSAPRLPRWPNLDPFLLADLEQRLGLRFVPDGKGDLAETFGPEDVFDYIYAILHSPTYRTRYAEFLKRDFPRIPFTSSPDLFAALAAKGRDLVALHLMESPLLDALITSFPEPGSDKVERVAYSDNHRRVYINKTQYFDGVPKAVWDFHVGGYQVCHKWLKDRKGRRLDNNDLMHYQRIIVALKETIRLMDEIDGLIPSWPLT